MYLIVNKNQLTQLPTSIGQLTNLEHLALDNNRLDSLPDAICHLSNLKTLDFSKNPLRTVPECLQVWAKPVLSQADSVQLNSPERVLQNNLNRYQNALSWLKRDTVNFNAYFSLSYYALFAGEYAQAIEAAKKTLELNPREVQVETNLALGYLLSNQYSQAEAIYKKWKGKKFRTSDSEKAETIFLKDITELEKAGIKHPDFEKIKRLLSE